MDNCRILVSFGSAPCAVISEAYIRYWWKMSTGLTTKVRVVKCPRCRQLLPELADFPLYKCGGCGAVLQAKSQKSEGQADSGWNYLKQVSRMKPCSSSLRNAAGKRSLDQSNESDGCNRQQPAGVNFCIEVPSSTELVCLDKEESSSPARAREGKEICAKSPDFTTLTTNDLSGATDMSSTIAAEGSIHVDLTSRNLKPFPCENFNQSERNDNLGSNWMSSTDTLENTESANISCEPGLMQKNMSKSPTTRSFYGYEGSVSSFDGNDNDVPDHFSRLSLCGNGMNFVGDGKSRIRDDFWQSLMSGSPVVQHRGKRSLQIPSSQRQQVIKQSNWNQDELEELMRREVLARRWRSKLERDEIASDRTSRGDEYVNGSPSGQGLGVFEHRSFCLAEEDKLKLFRMVHEIRDKLDRAYPQKGYRNGKIPNITAWKENQIPVDYNHPRSKEEICQGFDYTLYPPRSGRCWCRQCTFFGVPFSGEVARNEHSDHHVDCSSCLCCYNQDWQYLTQLNTRKSYNSRISMPLCPNSEDQAEATREKHQVVKRHFRPIAGAAPFIICKCCGKMLHLPADFLLFRRRCHQLKCSACSEILKFSLRNRTHMVPYTPKDVDPPPSEVDIYDTRNLSVYANENNSQPVSLSCSENYGPSFCKSCSTEGEAPFEVRKKNLLGKESSCLHEPAVNLIKLSKTEKHSSEIEELQPRTGMPLHRLWGYSSPSEVINGSVTRN